MWNSACGVDNGITFIKMKVERSVRKCMWILKERKLRSEKLYDFKILLFIICFFII